MCGEAYNTYMKNLLATASFLCAATLHAAEVPELLRMADGRSVETSEMWERERRPELLKLFTERVYGVRPEERPRSLEFSTVGEERTILGGLGVRRRVKATYSGPLGTNSFEFTLYIPAKATAEKPVPAFLMVCLREVTAEHDPDGDESALIEQWPVAEILRRGCATAGFLKDQLSPDMNHANLLGVFSVYETMRPYRAKNRWGTLSAWAWGASRVMDYLETEKRIDSRRVAVVGHSRGGKTALLAGATDGRFAMVCSNDSGCSGAKLNHMEIEKSEHIAEIVRTFPYWFCPNYVLCVNRDAELDFDQHEFLALIAPRLLCVGSASEDRWAGPRGEFEAARLASPAWELYGLKGLGGADFPEPDESVMEGRVEYHLRRGPHRITEWDWKQYLDFAERNGWPVGHAGGDRVLKHDLVEGHFRSFNAADEELYRNEFDNSRAAATIGREIPLFECPDQDVERTYYFRWWTYRKHIRRVKDGQGWVVTEFLPDVSWAGAENTISCPFGHHVREGRWIRNGEYLDGYIDFMVSRGSINGPRAYLSWPAWSALERAKVTGDFDFVKRHLDDFVRNFDSWRRGWGLRSLSLAQVENVQGANGIPLQGGFRAERGLFDFTGDREGAEFALSQDGARPLVNAAMWAEAKSIAEIAREAGRRDIAERFAKEAAGLEENIKARLWNPRKEFFTALSVAGEQDDVCELNGYAPFYFGMELRGYESAWKPLMDERGFYAPMGLTFPTRDTPGFDVSMDLKRHECLWNGPSWPYATSIALTALYESLQSGLQLPVSAEDFAKLVSQYARQHRRTLEDGRIVPWIDENLDPFTGEWIARRHLLEWDRNGIRELGCRERGKDYNHSTFCDIVIAGLCGFVPQADGKVVVRPLAPKSWDWWCVDGIRYHGRDITVLFDRDGTRYGRGKGIVVITDGNVSEAGGNP